MCGIAGMFRPDGASDGLWRSTLEAMATSLAHRGPDDRGTWHDADAGIGFGHVRLAVVDLSSTGAQPMVSADGRYHLATNSEIYNFHDLRQQLEARSHAFRGTSDTEVMLAAFVEWGVDGALERCNGMFACALWDRQEQCLHLVRDRLGEKPLYYGRVGDRFAFASELRALRRLPDFDAPVDREALTLLLEYGYVPAPKTIHQGISKLPAGCRLRVDPAGEVAGPIRWWRAMDVARDGVDRPLQVSDRQAIDRLDQHLRRAVARRLVADVPVGAFLSGGIDSSLVVALMQELTERPVKTFTIGFREPRFDESPFGRAVAEHLGTEHTELRLEPEEALQVLPELPTIYDEPFADPSQIPTFLVSRLARRQVTVVLSGDGGDELFGGYRRYLDAERLWRRVGRLPSSLRRSLARGLSFRPPLPANGHRPPGLRWAGKCNRLGELLRAEHADDLYRQLFSLGPEAEQVVVGGGHPDTDWIEPPLDGPLVHRWMSLDLQTYLPEGVLVKLDRASMRVALEGRLPLLDPEVVAFAWRLPLHLKIRDGHGKWILRRLLDRYVPRPLVDRPKAGFELPLADWLRGPLRPWANSLLDTDRLHDEGFFQPQIIERRWREHLSGIRDWRFFLWCVLMFQSWYETIE